MNFKGAAYIRSINQACPFNKHTDHLQLIASCIFLGVEVALLIFPIFMLLKVCEIDCNFSKCLWYNVVRIKIEVHLWCYKAREEGFEVRKNSFPVGKRKMALQAKDKFS